MEVRAPERTDEYRNHHLDSTRWDGFVPRDDDIFVTTAYKARTTRHARRVHVDVQPLLRLHGAHVHAVQRCRPAGPRASALPSDPARDVATLDRRGLVRLGARWLAVLSHHHHLATWWDVRDLPKCCSSTTTTSRPTPNARCAASRSSAISEVNRMLMATRLMPLRG